MNIKLITYNIWDGTHLEKVIKFLQAEKPDVVQFQEIGTVGRGFEGQVQINIFEDIKKALGMEGTFKRMFWANKGFDIGVATLAKYPVLETTEFGYERTRPGLIDVWEDRYDLPRKLLGVKLDVSGGLWFFNTHLTITPEATVTKHQLQSVAAVKNFLAKYPEYILTGDMNTPYNSETYQRLVEGLTDVSNPKEPTLHPTIHKVGNLQLHVDYVFYRSTRIKHLATRIPLTDGSDHLPVVVEFELYD